MLACYYTYTCRCFFLHIDFFVPLNFLEMPRKNATKCNGKDLKQRFTFVIHFPIRTCRFPCLVLRQKYSIIIILSLLSFHFFLELVLFLPGCDFETIENVTLFQFLFFIITQLTFTAIQTFYHKKVSTNSIFFQGVLLFPSGIS